MRKFGGYMHGINLGGWLSQSDDISEKYYNEFITENDIKYIASLGCDHVRVPVDYNVIESEDGSPVEKGYLYLDRCIEWCRKYSLNTVIDLHKTFGYSFDPLEKSDKTAFFYNESLQKRFCSLWNTISSRYGKYDTVAFELLNEIVEPEVSEQWNVIALKAIRTIRCNAPDSWIIFGGTMYNSVMSVPQLAEPTDDKIAYTFHCYEPMVFTHQGAYWVENMPSDFRIQYPAGIEEYRHYSKNLSQSLACAVFSDEVDEISADFFEKLFQPALRTAEEKNVPLYCGEYGVIDLADDVSKAHWITDICSVFDKYGIGRALWNYKEKDFGITSITNECVRKTISEKL